jgi:hypothetical protein
MGSRIISRVSVVAGLMAAFVLVACGGADVAPPHPGDGGIDAGTVDAGPDARLDCPDPLPAPAQCDFFLSCGCDVAAGEKCSIDSQTNARDCFQRGGKHEGEVCSQEMDCEAGTLCAVFGTSPVRRCMKYCDVAHACPTAPTAEACYIPVKDVANATVCGQVCDLLTQDCELADQGCYPSPTHVTTAEKGICAQAAAGAEGATCTIANDCAEGLTCLDGDSKCHKLCRVGGGAPACTTGTCQAIPGSTLTGVCK